MMSELIFSDRPHIPLLQWLARGSLKQNLLRAIRLWVWLRTLYGDRKELLFTPSFTYAAWRDTFFSADHPKGEEIPNLHNPHCACAKTAANWLFEPESVSELVEWRRSLLSHDTIAEATLNQLLQRRLFAVTRRSLHADLQMLTELGWLKRQGQRYYQVSQLPNRPIDGNLEPDSTRMSAYSFNFLHPDLAAIAQNHSRQVGDIQRFFLRVDYVIPNSTLDLVDDWQDKLRHFWQQNPVPPVKLTYQSASLKQKVQCIVYPVCIYYFQRAVYLCAFGQTPTEQREWHNYRLDRIKKMTPLDWKNPNLPQLLRQRYPKNLPTPDYIEEQLAQAWGFDFYLEPKLMLLRFDRDFHDHYIWETERHETFQPITYQQAEQLIRQNTPNPQQQQALLKVLHSRPRAHAYYQVYYRDGDNNVGLRLRSWRPLGEVLLPWELRQTLAKEVEEEAKLYRNE